MQMLFPQRLYAFSIPTGNVVLEHEFLGLVDVPHEHLFGAIFVEIIQFVR